MPRPARGGPGGRRHAPEDRLDHFVRFDKKLQFHLLELPRPKGEVAGVHFVPERLAHLRHPEWQFLPRGYQHILELNENRLGGFGTQVGQVFFTPDWPDRCFEHQIEWPCLSLLSMTFRGHLAWLLRTRNFRHLV